MHKTTTRQPNIFNTYHVYNVYDISYRCIHCLFLGLLDAVSSLLGGNNPSDPFSIVVWVYFLTCPCVHVCWSISVSVIMVLRSV